MDDTGIAELVQKLELNLSDKLANLGKSNNLILKRDLSNSIKRVLSKIVCSAQ